MLTGLIAKCIALIVSVIIIMINIRVLERKKSGGEWREKVNMPSARRGVVVMKCQEEGVLHSQN